ncbi:MAG TPA: type II toxin-antitoxin system PemK/MazF family toxin [Hanamia sp.]
MGLEQYRIILVNLDPTIGSEIKKTRPCVIISPNEMNKYLNTLVIVPMTTQSKKYPTRVQVKHHQTQGWILVDQIRTIDKQRVVKIFDKINQKEIEELKAVIKETFVD